MRFGDSLVKPLRIAQVCDTQTAPTRLVLIRRPDAAAGRADLGLRRILDRLVEQLVVRQQELRAPADADPPLELDTALERLARLVAP